MNEKKLFELWNRTSEESFIRMFECVPEWRPFVARALLTKDLSAERLVKVLRILAHVDDKKTWFGCFESQLATHTLTAELIRSVLSMHNAHRIQDEVARNLQRQLLGLGATVEEVISLMEDRDSAWREKAVRKFLEMDATFKQWQDALRCWGDERHADVAPSLWKVFRARFPELGLGTLFDIANTCCHLQDEAVTHYLGLKPRELAKSADQVHLLYRAAGSVLNDPAYGGALWIRECLNGSQRDKMRRKAEQFLAYAQKLEKKKGKS